MKNKVHKESYTWIKKIKSNQVICFYNLNKDVVIWMIRILPQLDDINNKQKNVIIQIFWGYVSLL
jgi:hypothetical protein